MSSRSPFALTAGTDDMHLRIARMSPWRFVPNVLGIFGGTYRSPNYAFDFVGDEFLVEFLDDARGNPVQHSGDSLGRRQSFRLSVAGRVPFVDILGLPPTLKHLEPFIQGHASEDDHKEDAPKPPGGGTSRA